MTALWLRDKAAITALGPYALATPNFWDDEAVFQAYVAYLTIYGGSFTTHLLDEPGNLRIIENTQSVAKE